MNALKAPLFSPEDLKQLNGLLNKLEQPPAIEVHPRPGDRFEPVRMKDATLSDGCGECSFVLEVGSIGVEWRGEVLKKADVIACTSDRLMVRNMCLSDEHNGIARRFADHLAQGGQISRDFTLNPASLEGFIDIKMLGRETEELFEALVKFHPEPDFSPISPQPNQWYNGDRMKPQGAQSIGQQCKVVEVIHGGLTRKRRRGWMMKALVKVRNFSRNER